MSKKQLTNRLNDLFNSLSPSPDVDLRPAADSSIAPELAGWSWSVDIDGKYNDCSFETKTHLGLEASQFLNETIWTYRINPSYAQKFKDIFIFSNLPAEFDLLNCFHRLLWKESQRVYHSRPVGKPSLRRRTPGKCIQM